MLRDTTGGIFTCCTKFRFDIVFKKEKRFVTAREKAATFWGRKSQELDWPFSLAVPAVLRPLLGEIVQCMTQLNALCCTCAPFWSLKSDLRWVKDWFPRAEVSHCCWNPRNQLVSYRSERYLRTPLWIVVASLVSVHAVFFSLSYTVTRWPIVLTSREDSACIHKYFCLSTVSRNLHTTIVACLCVCVYVVTLPIREMLTFSGTVDVQNKNLCYFWCWTLPVISFCDSPSFSPPSCFQYLSDQT